MTPYAQHFDAELRLAILQLLAVAPGYCANARVIVQMLREMGLPATVDQLGGQLAWLEEQRAITRAGRELVVATLTERGGDIAAGRSAIAGIARPAPGSS